MKKLIFILFVSFTLNLSVKGALAGDYFIDEVRCDKGCVKVVYGSTEDDSTDNGHITVTISNVIKRDGIYVAYANGIVRDTKTGLEWKVGPDKNTNWNQARSWVQSLNLDGGGWRMPTMDELGDLYKKGAGKRNMTPLLKTTGWIAWSGETKGSSLAGNFHFIDDDRIWDYRRSSGLCRAFAVRSRSDG